MVGAVKPKPVIGLRAILAVWVLFLFSAEAQEKFIRLRNEVIATRPADRKAGFQQNLAAEGAVSGLFLIQFNERLHLAMRDALRAQRVELLRYVPDDAFIARLENVRLSDIKSLAFVRWVGEYRAELKMHSAVRVPQKGKPVGDLSAVSILLSPQATPQEKAAVRKLMQSLQHESHSRFGGVLRGKIGVARLDALAQSPAVLWIEPAPNIQLFDEIAARIVGGDGGEHSTYTQSLDFDGSGVVVAVADSGLYTGVTNVMHQDLEGRVNRFFWYGALEGGEDEHSHGTHVTGIIAGNGATGELDETGFLYGLGVAPGAHIIAQRIFDGAGNYEAPPTFETLTRDAVSAGADIGSNSWGDDTQGRYDISAAEFDALVRDADELTDGDQQYILEFSAGNAGPGSQTIGSPAVAKNVIATGASQNNRGDLFVYADGPDAMADFSSRGPAEDGRIKPDVVAPGTWISSLRSPLGNDEFAWAPISDNYLYQGGTSQAGPQVSGAAAVLVQYFREFYGVNPSPALIKAALINSAANMDDSVETGPTPNMDEGWGRVDLTQIIGSDRVYEFVNQTALLTTGQTYERRVVIATSFEPLKITLAYTDVPGFPGAVPALVNDLDLEVVAPDGRIFRGNQFEAGESVPDAPTADNINNVEGVHILEPQPGEYIVRVRASNVALDARRDTPNAIDQDFALVVSGDIPMPGIGIVLFDRSAYTAPSKINLKLIDSNLAGQTSANVRLRSTTETNGELITLRTSSTTGVFTGSVVTVTGAAVVDGRLQIAHGNLIQADYFDASAGVTRIFAAFADLLPPVISNVSVTNQFGQMIVSWTTDEDANSVVRFNTNSTLSRSVTNSARVTFHEVELSSLVAGRTYRFAVSSTDAAGNTSTNNNGGANFTFVAVPASTVLLVDAYIPDDSGESLAIPLSTYTNAMAQTGVSYDVWNKAARGSPTLANLRSYQIVMWRINDAYLRSDDKPDSAEQSTIQRYLNIGGSFLMASMDLLTRVGEVPFRTNVLHVQRFIKNPSFEQCTDCDEDFGVPTVEGVSSDPIADGVLVDLDYSNYPAIDFLALGPDFSDTFGPAPNAAAILTEFSSGKACGLKYPRTGQDSTGRVVFLSFPLDAIPESAPAPNSRAALLRSIFQFLAPGLGGLGTIVLDQPEYTVPGVATVEVADSDLAGLDHVTVNFHSDSRTNRVPVVLNETARPGLFRGFIKLVALTNAPAPGELRAANGDTIYAEYYDASGHLTITDTAFVDTVPPAISQVAVTPQYENATVTWETSDISDALVIFGESPLLGRSAYSDLFDLSHTVELTGLAPNRTYYFEIVSRDPAGNIVVDDNVGDLYTFHTLPPLLPPFFDNLETGGTNWSTFNGEDSIAVWTLGVPQNIFYATEAHSPQNAWGSNLKGALIDYADTFLISPAFELTGGNKATLRFWHNYDFSEATGSELLEGGQLLLITNVVAAPVVLADYGETSQGWAEEEIDLSPYIGRVVFLVWHYQMLDTENFPRLGWLVDDISVTMTNVVPGTIQISNSLAQARFVLIGPMHQSGQGTMTFTNAPPGQYMVTFSSVPYYSTPAPQTNDLFSATTLTFQGNYTITDANHNGIADSWEQQYFSSVATNRTRFTDTDGDGFTDYAEFIAGTGPNSSFSKLQVTASASTNGTFLLTWPSSAGRIYRVEGSSNAVTWAPVTDWIRATAASASFVLPIPAPGAPFMFRLEVRP